MDFQNTLPWIKQHSPSNQHLHFTQQLVLKFYYMVSFYANINISTAIWTRKWQLKYKKCSKHIKRLLSIQKSQIKSDRSKEVFLSLKEQLMNYWPHSWISQDFRHWKGKSFDSLAKSLGSLVVEPVPWNVAFNSVGKKWVSLRFFILLRHTKESSSCLTYSM